MHTVKLVQTLVLAVLSVSIMGCHSRPPSPDSTPVPVATGQSLEEMKAAWAKMRQQYVADCLSGTPDHIRSTQATCVRERQQMEPLDNAITEAEIKAARR